MLISKIWSLAVGSISLEIEMQVKCAWSFVVAQCQPEYISFGLAWLFFSTAVASNSKRMHSILLVLDIKCIMNIWCVSNVDVCIYYTYWCCWHRSCWSIRAEACILYSHSRSYPLLSLHNFDALNLENVFICDIKVTSIRN